MYGLADQDRLSGSAVTEYIREVMWCVGAGVPVRTVPIVGVEVTKLPQYAKVNVLAESMIDHKGMPTLFYEIVYVQSPKSISQGWVYAGYLEPYHEEFAGNVVQIQNATPNPNDAAQYLVWMNNTQYNMCGHLSVSYCAGWDANIEDFLDLLKEKKLSYISRVFPQWRSRGTSDADLDIMLSMFDYQLPSVKISAALYDPIARRTMLTPGRMADILKDNRVIYSVRINTQTGKLARSGVLHWVVLEEVIPDEFRGAVKLYNPFNNKFERYAWEQLVESGGTPYGVLVPR